MHLIEINKLYSTKQLIVFSIHWLFFVIKGLSTYCAVRNQFFLIFAVLNWL
jgi:hypothetical protein